MHKSFEPDVAGGDFFGLGVRVVLGEADGFLEPVVRVGVLLGSGDGFLAGRVLLVTGIHSFVLGCDGLSTTSVVLLRTKGVGFFSAASSVCLIVGCVFFVSAVSGRPTLATSTYNLGPTKPQRDAMFTCSA